MANVTVHIYGTKPGDVQVRPFLEKHGRANYFGYIEVARVQQNGEAIISKSLPLVHHEIEKGCRIALQAYLSKITESYPGAKVYPIGTTRDYSRPNWKVGRLVA